VVRTTSIEARNMEFFICPDATTMLNVEGPDQVATV
jgi:hypothetical protein